ncbi:DUF1778 domain-containing protein [Leifsonia shinshuensis]|uniref:type II toxin-antitoxin system TacA family antitoxin n=1 Tax=Leifsonia shinshuensis TaxID=150026 RepID=UPI00285854B9|nr:DUF1778 domain-containing protein [Leifsonia shinshuensis]MDR6969931.1 uncharacterized protein (DUF1778 family) [Leifsonia shinshuensis]
MRASARLEFRVSPADRARIEQAAELAGEPTSTFARHAAEERAERILRDHEATTRVPAQFFDDLYAALDAPGEPNAALAAAADRLRGMTGE